mmetsp:Transcript_24532/g.60155  ORF Transcript_24532/g.60155 Transcript_24532/m.60155 type:complete len:399 (+) Transcript_24532:1273-2469(+)
MSNHPASSVAGDPSECWIKYDNSTNAMIEAAFKGQGGEGAFGLGNGYVVDFLENTQTKKATGYAREVQRIVNVKSALDSPKVWCWKETQGQMGNHSSSAIYGNPSDCWIKYDDVANAILESAFQAQGTNGEISPSNGYMVNFTTMKQTKTATGFERDVQRVDANDEVASYEAADVTAHWTPINGTAPDGSPAFVAPAPKSTTKGVNANPFKQNYIFAKKGGQIGYFHITTKECYEILAQRISASVRDRKQDIAMASCCGIGYVPKELEDNLEKCETAMSIAKARAKAARPTGKVGLPAKYDNNRQISNIHYSDTGVWYFPQEYYDFGGGCGASSSRALRSVRGRDDGAMAGGCGTSGCGAAACGTSGCGGGGCGGGGKSRKFLEVHSMRVDSTVKFNS